MDVRETVPESVQKAVVAAVLFTGFAYYAEDVTTLPAVLTEFALYVVALSIGFVVIDWVFTAVVGSVTQE